MVHVTIGYGSQTGNAKHISKHIKQELEAMNLECVVYPLEKFKEIDYTGFHVFIVSSTGDGDAPEHSLPFYKWLRKLKKQGDENVLFALEYCLLGLGDTNYTNFNGNAKRTLKYFKELKMKPVYRNEMADDAVGTESFVDPWIDELLQFLSNRFKSAVITSDTEPLSIVDKLNDLSLDSLSTLFKVTIHNNDFKPSRLPAHVKWTTSSSRPPTVSIFDFQQFCKDDFITKSSTHTIVSGRCLSQSSALKTTILATIKSTGHLYKAGDSIGIMVPNPETLVLNLLKIFGYTANNNPIIMHTEYGDISLYDLLRYKVELKFPSKRFFRLIAEYCRLEQEKRELLFLTSKEGSDEFNRIRDLKLNVFDVLHEFPSCTPPIYALSLLDVLKPRYYSVSKFDKGNDTLDIVFNLEQYKAADVDRLGLATNFLDTMLNHPRTYDELVLNNNKILAFPWPSTSFILDPDHPAVFIGPGSGIAPYLQFLHELQANQKAILIQGCRGSEEWILNNELSEITKQKALPYYVAYSRSLTTSIKSVHEGIDYSSDKISKIGNELGYDKQGAYVWDVLYTFRQLILEYFDDDATFYLCGDASNMVKMFMETMRIIISKGNGISMENADKIVKTMIQDKKIRMDVWG